MAYRGLVWTDRGLPEWSFPFGSVGPVGAFRSLLTPLLVTEGGEAVDNSQNRRITGA